MLAMTTDYKTDSGSPEPYLRRIAEAGFTALHWCHHWNTDFIYTAPEIHQIERWLRDYGLRVPDVHGSDGQEKCWFALDEYARLAGVDLVRNRLEFAARLGAPVVIMHAYEPFDITRNTDFWVGFRRSLDALEPLARHYGVRIALENLFARLPDGRVLYNFSTLRGVFADYPPDFIGLCYDTGHAHIGGSQLDQIAALADPGRLIAIHLHDNDGQSDLHKPLFSDSIDWPAVAAFLRRTGYDHTILLETAIKHTGIEDEAEFLRVAHASGQRFAGLLARN